MSIELKFKTANDYDEAKRIQSRVDSIILLDNEKSMLSIENNPIEIFIIITTNDPLRVIEEIFKLEPEIEFNIKLGE